MDPRAFPAASAVLRRYMHIAPDDPIDLVVMSAILANFAPDRLNPLWFVLIAAPESGKSMLLDVLLEGWNEVWRISSVLTPGYFLSGRVPGRAGPMGVLRRIDSERRRLIYMSDMSSLLPSASRDRQILHNQLIGIYDGNYQRESHLLSSAKPHVHKRGPRTRLGWIGAATEALYGQFLGPTFPLGARFTPYYWEPSRASWSSPAHLPRQRELRGQRLTEFHRVRTSLQAFLAEAVQEMQTEFRGVVCAPAEAARIDAATALAMRVNGGGLAPPGGRTSDRAVQLARTAAFLHGLDEVEQQHTDIGVHMVLSQMHPRVQQLLRFAGRRENLRAWWRLAELSRALGAERSRYESYVQMLAEIGVFDRTADGRMRLSSEALKLVEVYDPGSVVAERGSVAAPPPRKGARRVHADDAAAAAVAQRGSAAAPVRQQRDEHVDDPAEISMAELEGLEVQ